MPDKRGRVTLYLKSSHQKIVEDIQDVTGKDVTEVMLDSLKTEHRRMIQTGEIPVPVDNDVVVRAARRIARIMGNVDFDHESLDHELSEGGTVEKVDGNYAVN